MTMAELWLDFSLMITLRIMRWNTVLAYTNRVFRDTSAWYHIVISLIQHKHSR